MERRSLLMNGRKIIVYNPDIYSFRDVLKIVCSMKPGEAPPGGIKILSKPDPAFLPKKIWRKKINEISLVSPFSGKDKREKSIGITPALIFIGSELRNHKFDVDTYRLNLSQIKEKYPFESSDMAGFTLFEDFFPEIKSIFDRFSMNREFLSAAGGPLISLNPLQSIYHLHGINLFVRGEAEFLFPELLTAINRSDYQNLFTFGGYLFQIPGLIIVSNFSEINYPADFSRVSFNLDFIKKEQLKNGLEINFSRGCRNSCVFCSHVQGRKFRKLPVEKISLLLKEYSLNLKEYKLDHTKYKTININDDDILQDPDYTRSVLRIVQNNGFTIWGIQSSLSSLFGNMKNINQTIIDLIADDSIFAGKKILWIGTDTFLPARAKRLGKKFPGIKYFRTLLCKLEKEHIYSYHYWISSDYDSTWPEFIEELITIIELSNEFDYFKILPHAPFLIPYSGTPCANFINSNNRLHKRIKFRKKLFSEVKMFEFNLPSRIETGFYALNEILMNESSDGNSGFIDYLNNYNFKNALLTAYEYIKLDRFKYMYHYSKEDMAGIRKAEKLSFKKLSTLMKNDI